jgi:D-alanine--poly(phosphoribitol) ligase subunit 2
MSETSTVQDQIATWFLTTLKLDVPSADTDLFESGVLDSMAFVELLLNLERTFGLKVAVEELEIENFRSIRKIADFVTARDASSRPFPG